MEQGPPDPRIGQVLQGRYRILARVAAGAMGVVYRGERVELGRPVAVKFLHPWVASQQAFRSRFENEAKAMSRLSHPGCVSVIDFGIDGLSPYLVMDFVTGVTLRQAMDQGRMPLGRAVAVARQLLAGLSHAHSQGIVHRDLKPENLILSATAGIDDHVRILDFGLAKLRDGPAMTAGLAVGTPSYMSPEQTGGRGTIDGRTDIYTVGVLLFEMVTGKKPFVAEKIAELMLMHRESPPPTLREAAPDVGISKELEAVVARALAKMQEDRFQTAEDFAVALDRVPEARAPRSFGAAAAPSAAGASPSPAAKPGDADATIIDPIVMRSTGGSPAEAASAKAAASAKQAGGKRDIRRWVGLGGMGAVAIALVVAGVAQRRPGSGPGAKTGTAADPAKASAPGAMPRSPAAAGERVEHAATTAGAAAAEEPKPPAPPPPSVAERLADADRLVAAGEWEQALVVLGKARRDDPQSAGTNYRLANVYFENRRYGEGVEPARLAAERDARLRGDERLVKNLIRSLGSDRSYDRSADVLRGFGAPAVPFLKEAAAHDKNPVVRQRAADILQVKSRVTTRSGGGSRPASGSRSIFQR
jgi:eukaryotic-like serine/threonine-protein kinase